MTLVPLAAPSGVPWRFDQQGGNQKADCADEGSEIRPLDAHHFPRFRNHIGSDRGNPESDRAFPGTALPAPAQPELDEGCQRKKHRTAKEGQIVPALTDEAKIARASCDCEQHRADRKASRLATKLEQRAYLGIRPFTAATLTLHKNVPVADGQKTHCGRSTGATMEV